MGVNLNVKMFILKGLTFLLKIFSLKILKNWLLSSLMVLVYLVTCGRYRYPGAAPLCFHWKRSANMKILKGTIGKRRMGYDNGILFSERPIKTGEKIKIELSRRTIYEGGIYIGFTRFNPDTLSRRVLPNFRLLSRQQPNPGVWLHGLTELGKAEAKVYLTFWLSPRGVLEYRINKKSESSNFQLEVNPIPTDVPLWACFDLSGRFDRIRIINEIFFFQKIANSTVSQSTEYHGHGVVYHANVLRDPAFVRINSPRQCITSKIYPANDSFDCIVCEDQVTVALLPCMHACMCLDCIKEFLDYGYALDRLVLTLGLLQKEPFVTRQCPMCREAITGVIGPSPSN